jgi:ethanolamine ammonia-lyase large subunit
MMGMPGADDVMLNYQSTSFHDACSCADTLGLKRGARVRGLAAAMQITDAAGQLAPPSANRLLADMSSLSGLSGLNGLSALTP